MKAEQIVKIIELSIPLIERFGEVILPLIEKLVEKLLERVEADKNIGG